MKHWLETRGEGLRYCCGLHTDSQNDVIDPVKSGGAGGRGAVWCGVVFFLLPFKFLLPRGASPCEADDKI